MEREPLSSGCIVAAIVLLIVLPLFVYVGGYFALCEYENDNTDGRYRAYPEQWQADMFRPAAKVHEILGGKKVVIFKAPHVG